MAMLRSTHDMCCLSMARVGLAWLVLSHMKKSSSMSLLLENGHATFNMARADLYVVVLTVFSINRKMEVF